MKNNILHIACVILLDSTTRFILTKKQWWLFFREIMVSFYVATTFEHFLNLFYGITVFVDLNSHLITYASITGEDWSKTSL